MAKDRYSSDTDEKRLNATVIAARQNSEWAKARRRDRLRLVLAIVIVAAAIRWVPWAEVKSSVLGKLGVEITAVDAGTP